MLHSHASDVFPDERPAVMQPTAPSLPVITSAELLAHGKLIHIQHRGELYALRETRLGKLILTK